MVPMPVQHIAQEPHHEIELTERDHLRRITLAFVVDLSHYEQSIAPLL
jgi:hypothetical protein